MTNEPCMSTHETRKQPSALRITLITHVEYNGTSVFCKHYSPSFRSLSFLSPFCFASLLSKPQQAQPRNYPRASIQQLRGREPVKGASGKKSLVTNQKRETNAVNGELPRRGRSLIIALLHVSFTCGLSSPPRCGGTLNGGAPGAPGRIPSLLST